MTTNPHRYRAALQQLESRHATAGCLLALLLLLPLTARSVPVAVLSIAVLLYVSLVVPVATGFLSATVVIGWFRLCTTQHSMSARQFLKGAFTFLRTCHSNYLSMQRLHPTASQILFNFTAERIFCPNQPGSCVYALLLCSILAYVHSSLKGRVWSQLPPSSSGAGVAGTVGTLVAARLAKTVVLAFGLLGLTDRLDRLQPGTPFMLLCGGYFLLTQWPGGTPRAADGAGVATHGLATATSSSPSTSAAVELVVGLLALAPPACGALLGDLEGLEGWWVPLAVRLLAALAAALLGALGAWAGHWLLATSLLYAGAAVPAQAAWRACWPALNDQLQMSARFARPTEEQVSSVGTCAVCLDTLDVYRARAAPCSASHVFHRRCLMECANRFGVCPLCKRTL